VKGVPNPTLLHQLSAAFLGNSVGGVAGVVALIFKDSARAGMKKPEKMNIISRYETLNLCGELDTETVLGL
jgi:hypothetical protein